MIGPPAVRHVRPAAERRVKRVGGGKTEAADAQRSELIPMTDPTQPIVQFLEQVIAAFGINARVGGRGHRRRSRA